MAQTAMTDSTADLMANSDSGMSANWENLGRWAFREVRACWVRLAVGNWGTPTAGTWGASTPTGAAGRSGAFGVVGGSAGPGGWRVWTFRRWGWYNRARLAAIGPPRTMGVAGWSNPARRRGQVITSRNDGSFPRLVRPEVLNVVLGRRVRRLRCRGRIAGDQRARRLYYLDIRGTYSVHTGPDGRLLFVAGYLGVTAHPVENLVGKLHVIDDLILSVHNSSARATEQLGGGVELRFNRFQVRDPLIERTYWLHSLLRLTKCQHRRIFACAPA